VYSKICPGGSNLFSLKGYLPETPWKPSFSVFSQVTAVDASIYPRITTYKIKHDEIHHESICNIFISIQYFCKENIKNPFTNRFSGLG